MKNCIICSQNPVLSPFGPHPGSIAHRETDSPHRKDPWIEHGLEAAGLRQSESAQLFRCHDPREAGR